jgi:hypothetical protein
VASLKSLKTESIWKVTVNKRFIDTENQSQE